MSQEKDEPETEKIDEEEETAVEPAEPIEEGTEETQEAEEVTEAEVVETAEEEVPAAEVVEEPSVRPAAEPEAEAEEGEEEIEVVEERFYTIPFRKAWISPRQKRVPRSMRMLRAFVARHMKAEEVSISNEVNEYVWSRSIKKPPRKMRIRVVKDKEGRVIVYPAEAAA
jgi:large subunit ribosomal protein L31e